MRVRVVVAGGTIGRTIVEALRGRHEVVEASHRKAAERVDIQDPTSGIPAKGAAGVHVETLKGTRSGEVVPAVR